MNSTLEISELDTTIGRLFMAGMPGTQLDSDTEKLIRDYCLSGIILFSRNIEDPLQLARLCSDLQETAIKHHGIPLFLAIDQEGGRVSRFKAPFTLFPGNTAIGDDPEARDKATEFARITAREMTLVGLNMNLAPVVDVRRGEPEKHLRGRTFSDDPEKVASLGRTVIKMLQQNGVPATAKHFPGLGKATMDPHHDLPTIHMPLREIEEINLPPFIAAIAEGVSAVMTSHAVYPSLDPDYPSTLSHKTLQGLLREKLGFKGLIITDDLEMGAVAKKWGIPGSAVASFEAGADLLLICENQDMVLESLNELKGRLLRGEISLERLRQSLDRIKDAKSGFLKNKKEVSLKEVGRYFTAI
ncbi:MAG: beta-N-acetylhexosaminidase [Desulfobacterales bacterium]|nr:beta-N-acetylhexosaminidase [Desulfobacterales bacterium]